MKLEQVLKKMWDNGYKQIAESHYRRPIFSLQNDEEIKEYIKWMKESVENKP